MESEAAIEPASAGLPIRNKKSKTKSVHSVNSFERWGLPVDEEAGPGSHEVPGLIGKTSHRYSNQPNISFPKAPKRLEKLFISKEHEREGLGRESPGPGAHNLLDHSFGTTAPRVAIGTGKARYLECFENLKSRSPGPIYSYLHSGDISKPPISVPLTQGTFPKASRDPVNSTKTESPSPVDYNPMNSTVRAGVSMKGKSGEGHVYLRNLETFMKGKDSPGPASYLPQTEKLGRGFKFSSVGRDVTTRILTVEKTKVPGPGSYNEELPAYHRTHTKKSSFGTSPRKFDPRKREE